MTDLLMALLLASIGVELFATPQPQLSRRTPFWYSALAQEGVLFMALSGDSLQVSETGHGQNAHEKPLADHKTRGAWCGVASHKST